MLRPVALVAAVIMAVGAGGATASETAVPENVAQTKSEDQPTTHRLTFDENSLDRFYGPTTKKVAKRMQAKAKKEHRNSERVRTPDTRTADILDALPRQD